MRQARHRLGISHVRQIGNSQSHTKGTNIDVKEAENWIVASKGWWGGQKGKGDSR